ncbi:MAG: B12-binding domain-containing radical SAM protein [Spirochaetes bacterium]|nr:B12-binding domain-containing radical SAM protein [Spirochaetota bacterium]
MIKILFINTVNPYSEVETRYPPLWPAYLAAYVEKKCSNNVFDFKFADNKIKKVIHSYQPNIVAISSVTQNYKYAIHYAKIAKKHNIPVIIGGIHITSLPNNLTEEMDIGCIGEGEQTFLELLEHYQKYQEFNLEYLNTIDGIVFRKNNELVITRQREPIENIADLPLPYRKIIGYPYRGYVYTARGCAYNCVFCICSKYWGKIRYSSANRVIEEIKEVIDNGTKVIRFADENFSGNIKRLKEIADRVVQKGYHNQVRFTCWCRANTINKEVVDVLKKMNVVSVKMGLESGCQKTLDYLKGNVKVEDNIRAIKLFKAAGIQVNGDFIIGAPDETEEEINQTYRFIKEMSIDFVDVNIFTAYPGTVIWDYAKEKNLVSDDMDWELINIKFQKTKNSCILLSNHLTLEKLHNIYKKFRRLIILKSLKALFKSPWRNEIPFVLFKRLREKLIKSF